MPLKPAPHHPRLHIAAQAQLKTQAPLGNDLPRRIILPDDVPQPVGLPRQQRVELRPRPAGLGLGEVHRDAQPLRPGPLEDGREEGDLAAGAGGGVATQVDARDPVTVAEGEFED